MSNNDVLDATPSASRHRFRKSSHSLRFIVELVKFGLMRNVGTSILYREGSETRSVDSSRILKFLFKSACSG